MTLSFLVLTYNPNCRKLIQTLTSIITQKEIDFEILICDDGSKINFKDTLISYFHSKNFFNYKLIFNEQNAGTVQNIISGLAVAQGDYIKLISPGDFIYADYTSYDSCNYMIQNEYDIIFGKCIHYNQNGIYINRNIPKLISPYLSNNYKKIKHNYFITRDLIIGASILYKKEILKKYINKISKTIKYSEDSLINYYLCENNKLSYINIPVIYYETGDGISTSNSSKWSEILSKEVDNLFSELYQQKLISKFIYKNQKIKNKYKRLFYRLIFDTSNFVILFFNKIFSKTKIVSIETDTHLTQILKESNI